MSTQTARIIPIRQVAEPVHRPITMREELQERLWRVAKQYGDLELEFAVQELSNAMAGYDLDWNMIRNEEALRVACSELSRILGGRSLDAETKEVLKRFRAGLEEWKAGFEDDVRRCERMLQVVKAAWRELGVDDNVHAS